MRIVQTFWTAGQDPLKHSFGWSHPQYNLMSWALSCLSLREHYDDVELYTDSAGYHILIEVLGLPYTKTHVVFDDFKCLPHHWALAKIKTYSMQTEPFIHVDGDIYVPKPFPADIIDAPLIVQNREIGTSYYKEMMDRILTYPTIRIPDYVAENLGNGSLASYNMGFFGGCDMDFIQQYCHEAFRFMEDNHMNDSTCEHSSVWCNIFFEQVLLAVLADREGIRVADVLGRSVEDEGYTVAEFSDLERYEEKQFFHLLGGHKRCRQNYEMIEKTILRLYPDCMMRLLRAFPKRNMRISGYERNTSKMNVQASIAQYEDILEEKGCEWSAISTERLLDAERKCTEYVSFIKAEDAERDNLPIYTNPMAYVFATPTEWHKKAVRIIKQKYGCEDDFPMAYIAMRPCLQMKGIKETPLVDFQKKILDIVDAHGSAMPWGKLKTLLHKEFVAKSEATQEGIRVFAERQTIYLLRNGLLTLSRIEK